MKAIYLDSIARAYGNLTEVYKHYFQQLVDVGHSEEEIYIYGVQEAVDILLLGSPDSLKQELYLQLIDFASDYLFLQGKRFTVKGV